MRWVGSLGCYLLLLVSILSIFILSTFLAFFHFFLSFYLPISSCPHFLSPIFLPISLRSSNQRASFTVRRFFIKVVARDLNLIFPSSTATAITIWSMHSAATGAKTGHGRMRGILVTFVAAVLLRLVSQYAPGIFWVSIHFPLFILGSGWSSQRVTNKKTGLASLHLAGRSGYRNILGRRCRELGMGYRVVSCHVWVRHDCRYQCCSLVFSRIGHGMVCHLFSFNNSQPANRNNNRGILGPYLVSRGLAFGEPVRAEAPWSGLIDYFSMSTKFANPSHPSPRYWLLWPGVAAMLAVAFIGNPQTLN